MYVCSITGKITRFLFVNITHATVCMTLLGKKKISNSDKAEPLGNSTPLTIAQVYIYEWKSRLTT